MKTCPAWSDDARGTPKQVRQLERQLKELLVKIVDEVDRPVRPVRLMLDSWHLCVFRGLPPLDYYAGNMRGEYSDKPCLAVDVQVGGAVGTPYWYIPNTVDRFDTAVDMLLQALDNMYLDKGVGDLKLLFDAVAWITCRFIRIHPYINGNGRLSRVISNALLFRYGLDINTVRLNPRPDQPYSDAGAAAMIGEYLPMRDYLLMSAAR